MQTIVDVSVSVSRSPVFNSHFKFGDRLKKRFVKLASCGANNTENTNEINSYKIKIYVNSQFKSSTAVGINCPTSAV